MNVAVLPCADPSARENYSKSIEKPVSEDRIRSLLEPFQSEEVERHFGGPTLIWGVTPGGRDRNRNRWRLLRSGDLALFYRDWEIFSRATVVLKLQNAQLARNLWGEESPGVTWEYLLLLRDLQEIRIPISRYNSALGYKPRNVIQSFEIHKDDKALQALSLIGIDPVVEEGRDPPTPEDLQARLLALGELDLRGTAKFRTEATIFREHLFGNLDVGKCDICGRQLPAGLLVAAHIKPRSSCTDDERRQLHVVMRACKLGCDELYERGFIYVDLAGKVRADSQLAHLTPDLQAFADSVEGKTCGAFSDRTRELFRWHRDHRDGLCTGE